VLARTYSLALMLPLAVDVWVGLVWNQVLMRVLASDRLEVAIFVFFPVDRGMLRSFFRRQYRIEVGVEISVFLFYFAINLEIDLGMALESVMW
jgi:hypothetical protein